MKTTGWLTDSGKEVELCQKRRELRELIWEEKVKIIKRRGKRLCIFRRNLQEDFSLLMGTYFQFHIL